MRKAIRALISAVLVSAALPASAGGFQHGLTAYRSGDYATAREVWRPLAEQGHAMAQLRLGLMYRYGHGVAQDFGQAVYWYRKTAAQGDATAQNSLGRMYEYGYGVEQDYERAISCFRKAAAQGNASAKNSLAIMCGQGEGIARNIALRCEASKNVSCD
jgi:uncharacterized protein